MSSDTDTDRRTANIRKADRHTDRHKDSHTNTDIEEDKQRDTEKDTDRRTDIQIDTQTDTHRQIHRRNTQTGRYTFSCRDILTQVYKETHRHTQTDTQQTKDKQTKTRLYLGSEGSERSHNTMQGRCLISLSSKRALSFDVNRFYLSIA